MNWTHVIWVYCLLTVFKFCRTLQAAAAQHAAAAAHAHAHAQHHHAHSVHGFSAPPQHVPTSDMCHPINLMKLEDVREPPRGVI